MKKFLLCLFFLSASAFAVDNDLNVSGSPTQTWNIDNLRLTPGNSFASMKFSIAHQERILNPESDMVMFDKNFMDGTMNGLVQNYAGTNESVAVSSGMMRVTSTGAGGDIRILGNTPIKWPCVTVAVDIASYGGNGTGTSDLIAVGIKRSTDTTNRNEIWVDYNKVGKTIRIVVLQDGNVSSLASGTLATYDPDPTRLMLAVTGPYVSAWTVGTSSTSVPRPRLSAYKPGGWDVRASTGLAFWVPFIAVQEDSGQSMAISRVKMSVFGSAGAFNATQIKYKDGTPVTIGNKMYFTATDAGFSDGNTSHGFTSFTKGIYSIDMNTYEIKLQGKIFTKLNDKIFSNHVSSIYLDPSNNTWTMTDSTFGDVDITDNLKTIFYTYKGDLLHGAHILTNPTNVTIAGQTNGYYDMVVQWVGSILYASYATSNATTFSGQSSVNIAFATGSALTSLTKTSIINAFQAEGPKIQKINGTWHVSALSINDATLKTWDLNGSTETSPTTVNTSNVAGNGTKSHTQFFSVPYGDGTSHYFELLGDTATIRDITYSALAYTQGNFIVQETSTTNTGWEFPRYRYPLK